MGNLKTSGFVLALGLVGCQAPNIVDQALLEAQTSQAIYHAAELEAVLASREAHLKRYETRIEEQERNYTALVGTNRDYKGKIVVQETQVAQLKTRHAELGQAVQAEQSAVAKLEGQQTSLAGRKQQAQASIAQLRLRNP